MANGHLDDVVEKMREHISEIKDRRTPPS